jgi:hypothetical protein
MSATRISDSVVVWVWCLCARGWGTSNFSSCLLCAPFLFHKFYCTPLITHSPPDNRLSRCNANLRGAPTRGAVAGKTATGGGSPRKTEKRLFAQEKTNLSPIVHFIPTQPSLASKKHAVVNAWPKGAILVEKIAAILYAACVGQSVKNLNNVPEFRCV